MDFVNSILSELTLTDTVILTLLTVAISYFIYLKFLKPTASSDDFEYKRLIVSPSVQRSESFDSNFVNRMKNSGRNIVIFYGSQTGTAEEYASRLAKDAVRYRMKGMVADPEECEMDELSQLVEIENSLAIFVMATYGEGEPTDNASEFYELLKSGEDFELTGVHFAVFGLGNKTYEHYNEIGKYVDKRLEDLGGVRIHELGLGDDDGNIEEDFVTWCESFWPAVCDYFGVEPTSGDEGTFRQYSLTLYGGEMSSPTSSADVLSSNDADVSTTISSPPIKRKQSLPQKIFAGEPARLGSFRNQRVPYDMKNPFLAKVVENRELHKGGERSCMHIEFDLTKSKIRYEAGDHLAIYAKNNPETVEAIGRRLNINLDQIFSLVNLDEEASKKHPFPCPCSYRTALSHYVDISLPPRIHLLKALKEYAADQADREMLDSLTASTPEAKRKYIDWIANSRRTILAILEDLPSLKPPIDLLLELLPRLQARYYSISSSPRINPNRVSITALLVKYQTSTGRMMYGVATHFLSKIKPPPVVTTTKEGACKKPSSDTILFYGCRNRAIDFIYEDELRDFLEEKKTLTHLFTAFSRDQEEKVYVQHLLKKHADLVWAVIAKGGHLYVCGDARHMAPDVLQVLHEIIAEKNNMTLEQATDYMKKMHTKGRYNADVWT